VTGASTIDPDKTYRISEIQLKTIVLNDVVRIFAFDATDPNGLVFAGINTWAISEITGMLWIKQIDGGTSGWQQVTSGTGSESILPYWDVVEDFGASNTGSGDASIAINAAIVAASAAGPIRNRVYIPPGTYTCLSTIQHLQNVHVFGTGPNTILQFGPGVNAWDFANSFDRAELSNLVILGVSAAPAPIGINLDMAQRVYLHDLQVWYFAIGLNVSGGGVFSAYHNIERCEINVCETGVRAYTNANGNRIVGSRVFWCFNAGGTGIGIDISNAQGLEIDDCQIESADTCVRVRNTNGLLNLSVHDCYFEPGTNPTTLAIGSCYDVVVANLFDGVETLSFKNNVESGSRGNVELPPEALMEFDGYSRAFFGARFHGASAPKRNYVYNGQLLYYGLPSVLPGWGSAGAPPTLSESGTFVTGNRSLQAVATGTTSVVSVGFTVSDDGVDWVTCGIRYQIIAGNTGFFFTGTVGSNSRQYVPDQTPTGVWREAWVNVPVDPANKNGAIAFTIDSVNGNGTILIDEAWAVPGKYSVSSTQYGERIQFLPAPVPIVVRTGITGNEAFGPIDILTLPSTLAAPLDDFSTAPTGVIGGVFRMFINCTGAPAGLIANVHQMYVDIPASGAIVAASFEFLQAVYSNNFHTKDIIVRDTTISGGYNAGDGFASDYNLALIAWVLA
jgi:hypothetical protein